MAIVVDIDVMAARRKIGVGELAERVGITPANMTDYLASPNVGCVGGSWLTPADVIARADWDTVAALARDARERLALAALV